MIQCRTGTTGTLDAPDKSSSDGFSSGQWQDIIPHDHGKNLDLKVVWKGKPAVGRTIFVRGPKGFRKNIKTNESGRSSFEIEGAGSYSFRTSIEIDKEGKDGEDTYQQIRHHATLIMQLPLKN